MILICSSTRLGVGGGMGVPIKINLFQDHDWRGSRGVGYPRSQNGVQTF